MKAVVVVAYGPKEGLTYKQDVPPPPDPAADEVLVRVRAAGTNPVDYKLRLGYLSTLLKLSFPLILGLDLAGVVERVGKNVTTLKVGDEVYGRAAVMWRKNWGSYAELALARARDLSPKLESLSFEEAAALPVAALTSLAGLKTYGKLKAGDRVLIMGGSGGVGSTAVQVAKALGAGFVGATCSSRNTEFVKGLGADEVYDYTTRSTADIVRDARPDVLLDCVGGPEIWLGASSLLAPSSRFVTAVGDAGDGPVGIGALFSMGGSFTWRALKAGVGRGPGYRFIASMDQIDLKEVTTMVSERKLRPIVDRVLPLSGAAEAHGVLESHRARGKIVLKVE